MTRRVVGMASNPTQRGSDLTADRLAHLLERLAPVPTDAAEQYTRLCRRLSAYFTWERCADPDRLADEVVDRVARRLADGEVVANLSGYVLGVARHVASEARARRDREARAMAELERTGLPDVTDDQAETALACLDSCLSRLDESRRRQLLTYYSSDLSARITERRQLAVSLDVKPVALRNRMLRLRQRLEICVARCRSGTNRDGSSRPPTEIEGLETDFGATSA